ncbi:MAG TPA: alginate export family protein, partial [Candidatus Hydrogenedentes bacterium]|nr:alginate export family protein [Candidatus Hydrogenedentota bacterium]
MSSASWSAAWVGVAVLVAGWLPASAELEHVRVGGELRIRGYCWHDSFNQSLVAPALVTPEVRWPARYFTNRAIGDFLGGQNVMSYWDWSGRGANYRVIQQRTELDVEATFTEDVVACISLDSIDVWGDDFRANPWTGVDAGAVSGDDIEVYQAFVEANEIGGTPLRLRLGRQELVLGGGWLVGNNTHRTEFSALSFDAIRATYSPDFWSLDAFCAKLNERSPLEQDGDVDLYGLYGAYTGIEDLSLDAYWLWVRDGRSLADTNGGPIGEALEEAFGLDDYPVTNLHTVGVRVTGARGALDFSLDGAYQFGDAGQVGFLFKPNVYGDDDASFSAWAGSVEAGYTFDVSWQLRIYLAGAYVDGEDHRDLSFGQWLNPFDAPEASVSFNRLFSDVSYSVFLDEMGELSNFWT